MRFRFRSKGFTVTGPLKYRATEYSSAFGIQTALRSERWVNEDEFIHTSAGAGWEELLAKIEAVKSGYKNDLEFKIVDGKYFFKAQVFLALEATEQD